jgi:hypothetical protein
LWRVVFSPGGDAGSRVETAFAHGYACVMGMRRWQFWPQRPTLSGLFPVDTCGTPPHKNGPAGNPDVSWGSAVCLTHKRFNVGECPERQRGRTVNPLGPPVMSTPVPKTGMFSSLVQSIA